MIQNSWKINKSDIAQWYDKVKWIEVICWDLAKWFAVNHLRIFSKNQSRIKGRKNLKQNKAKVIPDEGLYTIDKMADLVYDYADKRSY